MHAGLEGSQGIVVSLHELNSFLHISAFNSNTCILLNALQHQVWMLLCSTNNSNVYQFLFYLYW